MEYEIFLYRIPLGKVDYPRPCVVISSTTDFQLLNISTKPYEKFNCFTIRADHPDFPASGLTETSYVIGAPIINGDRKYIVKKLGILTGALAKEFFEWIG
jgi:hypothetical protein